MIIYTNWFLALGLAPIAVDAHTEMCVSNHAVPLQFHHDKFHSKSIFDNSVRILHLLTQLHLRGTLSDITMLFCFP